jgi:hypothetical protein
MNNLPPDDHERQHDDMRYSPDDFNPDMSFPVEEFHRFFRQRLEGLIEDYQRNGIRVSRHLIKELHSTNEELSDFYNRVNNSNKKDSMSWGDFRNFLVEREAYWDNQHPLPPLEG